MLTSARPTPDQVFKQQLDAIARAEGGPIAIDAGPTRLSNTMMGCCAATALDVTVGFAGIQMSCAAFIVRIRAMRGLAVLVGRWAGTSCRV